MTKLAGPKFNTTQILERGWRRAWIEPMLGQPERDGPRKLWPQSMVIQGEAHPVFIRATEVIDGLNKRGRFITKDDEAAAFNQAVREFKEGKLGELVAGKQAEPIDFERRSGGGEFCWLEWEGGAVHVKFADGWHIIVPDAFIEATRRGLRATREEIVSAMEVVAADWNAARKIVQPGVGARNYFLGGVKNVVRKLRDLERGDDEDIATGQTKSEPATSRHLH